MLNTQATIANNRRHGVAKDTNFQLNLLTIIGYEKRVKKKGNIYYRDPTEAGITTTL